MATTSYVKFERGTMVAFNKLSVKNPDTLYFVTDEDNVIYLYMGDKLIGGGSTTINNISIDALADVVVDDPKNKQILMYCEDTEKWMNVNPSKVFGSVAGATASLNGASGLVPAPSAGDQDKFLRGDGTWADVGTIISGETIDSTQVDGLGDVNDLINPSEGGQEGSGSGAGSSEGGNTIVNAINNIYNMLSWGEF